jgi:hypothetical protein
MSLATLKKKTGAKYNNASVNRNGFSINGTHRSQGWVGQDSIGRHSIRTPHVGAVPRGNGGCCGTYYMQNILPSELIGTLNRPTVKSSVGNTAGMLRTKYAWVHRPQPYTSVKLADDQYIQSTYIRSKSAELVAKIDTCTAVKPCIDYANRPCGNLEKHQRARGYMNVGPTVTTPHRQVYPITKNISMGANRVYASTQGEYLSKLMGKCPQPVVKQRPTNGMMFTCG